MLKPNLVLLVLVLLPVVARAQTAGIVATESDRANAVAASRGLDLTLGDDQRLAVHVPPGESIVFRDRTGTPTEIRTSGRVAIRPGSYSVEAGGKFTHCRVWAHGTAPPAAGNTLPIVRGQNHHDWLWRLDAITPHVIVVGGLGLGLWAALDSAS